MSAIIADADLRAKLNGLTEVVEIKTPDGVTIAHIVPDAEYRKRIYAKAIESCPYSDEELQRFQQEEGGCSLEEIWRRLGVVK